MYNRKPATKGTTCMQRKRKDEKKGKFPKVIRLNKNRTDM
jgi:hypothetical protein